MTGWDGLPPTLAGLVASQGGVFTAAQAREHGLSTAELQRMRCGPRRILTTLRRGVYTYRESFESAAPGEQHRLKVAALAFRLTGHVVLSHQTAAQEHGLELLEPDLSLLHVTREESQPRLEAGVHHHAAELPDSHVVRRPDALDLTSLARTAVDVARDTGRLECAVAAFDSALRMGVPAEELRAVFLKCRSWPGARFVSHALALADGRAANPGESWSRVVLIRQGLPPDDLQVTVSDAQGFIGYADFGWHGVLGEFDGKVKYGIGVETDPQEAARIVWREKQREDRLRAEHEVVRWGFADLHRPTVLATRVRAALGRAVARGLRVG